MKLGAMATDFGVSQEFIDGELHGLIASGALHARIDAARGVIETNRPDSNNDLYKTVIRFVFHPFTHFNTVRIYVFFTLLLVAK